jgi:hypothetical protein
MYGYWLLGSVNCSETLAKVDTAITIADTEAAESFSLLASRKAAKHTQRPTAAYTYIETMLTGLDYKGILRAHANLQFAVQEILRLTDPTSPVRRSRIVSGSAL